MKEDRSKTSVTTCDHLHVMVKARIPSCVSSPNTIEQPRKTRIKKVRAPLSIRKKLHGKAITTAIAANMLGISISEFRARCRDGIYKGERDARGWMWFSEADMRQISGYVDPPVEPAAPAPPSAKDAKNASIAPMDYTGELAQEVFTSLEQGKTPIQIVMEKGLHPEKVKSIAAMYADMKGTITLSPELKKEIEGLPLQGELPIVDGAHLVRILRESLVIKAPCAKCMKSTARLCPGCAASLNNSMLAGSLAQQVGMVPAGSVTTGTNGTNGTHGAHAGTNDKSR